MSGQQVTRYLFALSDNKVWAYILREDPHHEFPTYFELKPLGGMPCQDPGKCDGHMAGYLDQWKNAMGLMKQEERTSDGQIWQLPSLAGRSVCLLSDSSTRATLSEMTEYLDGLWLASEADRKAYKDNPWKREDFQEFLATQGQPFGEGRQIKAVKPDAITTNNGTLILKVYGEMVADKKPAPMPTAPKEQPKLQPVTEKTDTDKKPEEKTDSGVTGREMNPRKVFIPKKVTRSVTDKKADNVSVAASGKPGKEQAGKAPDLTAEQARAILKKKIEGQVDTVAEPR